MEKLKDIIQEYSTMRSLEVNKSRQEEANGNKDTAKIAWDLAWRRLQCNQWGSADEWSAERIDSLVTTAKSLLPKTFTSGNLIDNIREVFGEVEDISHKLGTEYPATIVTIRRTSGNIQNTGRQS